VKDALQATPRIGSRPSRIGIRTALAGLLLLALSGLAPRTGLFPPGVALTVYVAGSVLLLVALGAAGLGLLRSRGRAGTASAPATWLALVAGLAVTANNAVLLGQARGAPAIQDVSTDTRDPPAFGAAIEAAYPGGATATAQQQAYPDLQPVYLNSPASAVFAAARAVATESGWQVVAADEVAGHLEATATSGWLRLEADVVVRIQPGRELTRLDVRSRSRSAGGDRGVNARRVRDFVQAVQERLAR